MERMTCGLSGVEIKADAEAMAFEGYAAVFGNIDSYGDRIEPGAFAETIRGARTSGQWPALLSQHGSAFGGPDDMPIGVIRDLAEDGKGLWMAADLADTARGVEAYKLLKMKPRAALNGLSIGYRAKEFEVGTKPSEPRRTLKKIDLLEVSLVTFPANGKARVLSVKAIDDIATLSDAEDILRDAGMSRKDAVTFVAKVKRLSSQSESEDDAAQSESGAGDAAALAALFRSAIQPLNRRSANG